MQERAAVIGHEIRGPALRRLFGGAQRPGHDHARLHRQQPAREPGRQVFGRIAAGRDEQPLRAQAAFGRDKAEPVALPGHRDDRRTGADVGPGRGRRPREPLGIGARVEGEPFAHVQAAEAARGRKPARCQRLRRQDLRGDAPAGKARPGLRKTPVGTRPMGQHQLPVRMRRGVDPEPVDQPGHEVDRRHFGREPGVVGARAVAAHQRGVGHPRAAETAEAPVAPRGAPARRLRVEHGDPLARFREMQCRREPGIPGADHRDIAVLIPFETGPVAIEPPGAAGANRVFVGARFPQTFQSHLILGNGPQASRHSRPR